MSETMQGIPEEEKINPDNLSGNKEEDTETPICDLTYNSDTERITVNGKDYSRKPIIESFNDLGNIIKNSLPPIPDGSVRLWRGNRAGEYKKNPSFTNSLEGIAIPFWLSYGGVLSYIDLSEGEARRFLCTGAVADNSEFILPVEVAQQALVVPGLKNPNPRESKVIDQSERSEANPGWEVI